LTRLAVQSKRQQIIFILGGHFILKIKVRSKRKGHIDGWNVKSRSLGTPSTAQTFCIYFLHT
jgi:hypothetical protein